MTGKNQAQDIKAKDNAARLSGVDIIKAWIDGKEPVHPHALAKRQRWRKGNKGIFKH